MEYLCEIYLRYNIYMILINIFIYYSKKLMYDVFLGELKNELKVIL